MKLSSTDIRKKLEDGRDYKALEFAQKILENNLEKDLFKLSIDEDPVLCNRAMWILWHCSIIDYGRIKPFLTKLIIHLNNKTIPTGVVRCILAMFQEESVPVKFESFMLDKCFGYILDSTQAIAVRAFAMTVVLNISKKYPELLQELKSTLLHLPLNEESPGIRTRTRNTLKQIEKYQRNLK